MTDELDSEISLRAIRILNRARFHLAGEALGWGGWAFLDNHTRELLAQLSERDKRELMLTCGLPWWHDREADGGY